MPPRQLTPAEVADMESRLGRPLSLLGPDDPLPIEVIRPFVRWAIEKVRRETEAERAADGPAAASD